MKCLRVYSCAESRRVDATVDPDYTLIVRAQDMDGAQNALSGTTRVHIAINQNLWVNPGPVTIRENVKGEYPMLITTVSHYVICCHKSLNK